LLSEFGLTVYADFRADVCCHFLILPCIDKIKGFLFGQHDVALCPLVLDLLDRNQVQQFAEGKIKRLCVRQPDLQPVPDKPVRG
jgi:hypothetical protein